MNSMFTPEFISDQRALQKSAKVSASATPLLVFRASCVENFMRSLDEIERLTNIISRASDMLNDDLGDWASVSALYQPADKVAEANALTILGEA